MPYFPVDSCPNRFLTWAFSRANTVPCGRIGTKKTAPNQCANTDRGLTEYLDERYG